MTNMRTRREAKANVMMKSFMELLENKCSLILNYYIISTITYTQTETTRHQPQYYCFFRFPLICFFGGLTKLLLGAVTWFESALLFSTTFLRSIFFMSLASNSLLSIFLLWRTRSRVSRRLSLIFCVQTFMIVLSWEKCRSTLADVTLITATCLISFKKLGNEFKRRFELCCMYLCQILRDRSVKCDSVVQAFFHLVKSVRVGWLFLDRRDRRRRRWRFTFFFRRCLIITLFWHLKKLSGDRNTSIATLRFWI